MTNKEGVSRRLSRRVKSMGLAQMKAVWDAPATFNRASRRAAGLFGRMWRWDMALLDPGAADRPPRYVRRHWSEKVLTHPKTRRQRRHKARILRAMKGRMPV